MPRRTARRPSGAGELDGATLAAAGSFFGLDLSDHDSDIRIVLQSDSIVDILSSPPYNVASVVLEPDPADGPDAPPRQMSLEDLVASRPNGRLLKAREWVNRYDAAGARQLVLELRKFDRRTAYILPLRHGETPEEVGRPEHARGLLIAMGLGYTESSVRLIDRVCEGWAKIARSDRDGDCLEVNRRVLDHSDRPAASKLERLPVGSLPDEDDRGWDRLLPRQWNLGQWIANSDIASRRRSKDRIEAPGPSLDYAIILRHTNRQGTDQRVEFVCAGFSEFGTFRAGQYLATNWQKLQFEASNPHEDHSCGDFLAIIAGESFAESGSDWHLAHFVSDHLLADIADASDNSDLENARWVRRMHGWSEAVDAWTPKAFISYSHKDKDFVRELARRLRLDGVKVFLDVSSIYPGSEFEKEIGKALPAQNFILPVLTGHFAASEFANAELETALRLGLRAIPVIVGDLDASNLPRAVQKNQAVRFASAVATSDAERQDFEKQYRRILRSLRQRRLQRPDPPKPLAEGPPA